MRPESLHALLFEERADLIRRWRMPDVVGFESMFAGEWVGYSADFRCLLLCHALASNVCVCVRARAGTGHLQRWCQCLTKP
jgi:hypothetical protein